MASGALVGRIKLVEPCRKSVLAQTVRRSMVVAPVCKRAFRPVGKFQRQSELVDQNKRLLRENERLLRENARMLEAYSSGRNRGTTDKMCANALQVSENLKIMFSNMKSLK